MDVGGKNRGTVGEMGGGDVVGIVVDDYGGDVAGGLEEGKDGVVLQSFGTVDEREGFLGGDVVGCVGDGGAGDVVVEGVTVRGVQILCCHIMDEVEDFG